MKGCKGCNVCNQHRAARVPLTPAQVGYLRASRAVDLFNEHIALPLGSSKARLFSRSLAVFRPEQLQQITSFIPTSDADRIEVRGIAAAMIGFLEDKVFTFPMTQRDEKALANLKVGITAYGDGLKHFTASEVSGDLDSFLYGAEEWPAWWSEGPSEVKLGPSKTSLRLVTEDSPLTP